VSGGRSVRTFLGELSGVSVPWERVCITLSDERWVGTGSDDSNEGQLRKLFHQGAASAANIIGINTSGVTPRDGLLEAERRLKEFPFPAAATVLGFGEDGHVASLFVGDEQRKGLLIETCSPTFPRQRISMTMDTLLNTSHLFILAQTAEKAEYIEKALGDGVDCPIVHLIHRANRAAILSVSSH
jgi:6-phosphogluconolactonase